jgi:hypothetical protein
LPLRNIVFQDYCYQGVLFIRGLALSKGIAFQEGLLSKRHCPALQGGGKKCNPLLPGL